MSESCHFSCFWLKNEHILYTRAHSTHTQKQLRMEIVLTVSLFFLLFFFYTFSLGSWVTDCGELLMRPICVNLFFFPFLPDENQENRLNTSTLYIQQTRLVFFVFLAEHNHEVKIHRNQVISRSRKRSLKSSSILHAICFYDKAWISPAAEQNETQESSKARQLSSFRQLRQTYSCEVEHQDFLSRS